ncbi:exonuclease GOR-like [Homalodisca vitripennis]|uniref:exonuclease GOR-like n=1 Tax=Homalodisca vitripennis TaxID=197043 RepID=UPI001EECA0AB|nr:exonuclease GOR-like [Homalodisca vitripennis]
MWRTLFAFTTGDGWGSVDLTCCKDYPTSKGCTKCKTYVCSSTKSSDTGCHQLFALDCELVFTTMGLEVARVSLANGSSQNDALVQPEHEIIDFNTRFSGVSFPYEHGLTCRRSLKSVAQEYLGKHIQSSATGHDSMEDATAALRLVLKRIRMDRDASDPPKYPAGKSSSKI